MAASWRHTTYGFSRREPEARLPIRSADILGKTFLAAVAVNQHLRAGRRTHKYLTRWKTKPFLKWLAYCALCVHCVICAIISFGLSNPKVTLYRLHIGGMQPQRA
jgi:hypothetical protein